MKILFVGTHVPNEIEAVEPGISSAGNRFQNNFIKNLRALGHDVIEVSFIAVPIIDASVFGDASRYVLKNGNVLSAVNRFHKLVKAKVRECDLIICYNIVYAWLDLPSVARRAGLKSIAVIADYSEEDSFKSPARKAYVKLQRNCMRKFDKVVGLSSNIKKQLRPSQEFVLVEGGIDRSFYEMFASAGSDTAGSQGHDTINVMYSGLLEPVTGVDLLLDAIKDVDKSLDVTFVFTGKGSLSDRISEAARQDPRIDFRGNLSYDDYTEALKNADILVNPRNMHLPENRNNFPSKVMDYLATGNTIVSTKFAGYDKFEGHIIFSDEDDLARTITDTVNRIRSGELADCANREFAEKFLWDRQISGILK